MLAMALEYLDKLYSMKSADSIRESAGLILTQVGNKVSIDNSIEKINKVFNDAMDLFEKAASEEVSLDIFKM